MKRVCSVLLAVFTVISLWTFFPSLSVPASISASTIKGENEGDALYSLGLIKGMSTTTVDYGLTSSPTRSQAVVMVVRFLGAEETALAGSYKNSFTDVPDWAKAYIGYAYEQKITAGVSDTLFDPDTIISEGQFLTFMLRTLGYEDKNDGTGDFIWSDPYSLAASTGLITSERAAAAFTRAGIMEICYKALGADIKNKKGGIQTMADKLIKSGLFTSAEYEEAKKIAEMGAGYQGTPLESSENADYNIISIDDYIDKTTAGFLSQLAGFLSGYEFVRNPDGTTRVAMPDDWFTLCGGPYAVPTSRNPHESKLIYNEESKLWEVWTDDDYSIDILDQYLLRDMYTNYGTFATKLITDGWVKYDVYDMGGGNRQVGAYGLMKNKRYLPIFSGSPEYGNKYSYCPEPYIGNETLGLCSAGMPNVAVDMAEVFGGVTGEGHPVAWLKFYASMYSMAYFQSDIPTLIKKASTVFAEGSWEREVVSKAFELYEKYPESWRRAVLFAEKECWQSHYYNDKAAHQMTNVDINNAFTLLGLLYGKGDYYETCKILSLVGYDGDCTAAIGLSVVAIIEGMASLPEVVNDKIWQDGRGVVVNLPVVEKSGYWMHAAGLPERFKISEIINMYRANFERILLENGGKIEDGKYYIPKNDLRIYDTVAIENAGFESGKLDNFTVIGSAEISETSYRGSYGALVYADEKEQKGLYTTVSGLTPGSVYRMTAYVCATSNANARIFARAPGAQKYKYTSVYYQADFIKRELIFTAEAQSMEIGILLEAQNSFGYAVIDNIVLTRIEENAISGIGAAKITPQGGEANEYTGSIDIAISGGTKRQVYLKVIFSNSSGGIVDSAVTVNGEAFNTVPFYKTGSKAVYDSSDCVYIPVILNKDQNTVTLDIKTASLNIFSAEVVTVSDRLK